MNIKISIVFFILLSFFNLGAISKNFNNTQDSFKNLENSISSTSKFEADGVKLQYKTTDNIEKEIFRIKQHLINNIDGNYEDLRNNEFEIYNKDLDINIKMWYEGKYTYVEIILLNKNLDYSTTYLKDLLKNTENNKMKDVQYFVYYEGKELNRDYTIDKLINENNLKNVKFLDINNGYAGTGYLSNGDKINFALIKYDTGSHIIIGTPMIFATY
ncbi:MULTISPECIES: hypothetical protein [unclassified Clostridium]|uniref:hypothetical protein n=1 Tax=unclassified Clostridium TaxID=2614128 RepID=UPI00029748B6|nr:MULTISPECIES: hypothetical protein [unclassified Clostridium]EKQ50825.1 MAG: hypothetical protein A370_05378 [Clostridium sp. Maddingley MBC34-26]